MRRTKWQGVALGCFLMLTAAGAQAAPIINQAGLSAPDTLIDFGPISPPLFPLGTDITNQFAGDGVIFGFGFRFQIFPTLADNMIGGVLGAGGALGQWSVFFTMDVAAAGFHFSTPPGVTTTFEALLDGVVVESFSSPTTQSGLPTPINFFGFESIVFDEIRFTEDPFDCCGFAFDNLQFNVAGGVGGVPEPTTLLLLGLGLAGLGFARKRLH